MQSRNERTTLPLLPTALESTTQSVGIAVCIVVVVDGSKYLGRFRYWHLEPNELAD